MRPAISLIYRILLFPLSVTLALVVRFRNWLYDNQILKSTRPGVFTINVGNLNLGGTGKTPHVEYLVSLLAMQYKLSILSRGYKRETEGFVLADHTATAKTIGDEPMQYYLKFKTSINTAVCEDRVYGINKIQALFPGNELIILDDAFQHRKIAAHLNLLLCDYNRPFYKDFLVPLGKLRDIRSSAKRADAVIVTKCPEDVPSQINEDLQTGIASYTRADTPIFFSRIQYKSITPYTNSGFFDSNAPLTLVTAIAKPEVFLQYFTQQGIKVDNTLEYSDHFAFSRKEIDRFFSKKCPSQQIVTTEKDMVKLKPLLTDDELGHFFYLPIEVMISDKTAFDSFISERAKTFISENT